MPAAETPPPPLPLLLLLLLLLLPSPLLLLLLLLLPSGVPGLPLPCGGGGSSPLVLSANLAGFPGLRGALLRG